MEFQPNLILEGGSSPPGIDLAPSRGPQTHSMQGGTIAGDALEGVDPTSRRCGGVSTRLSEATLAEMGASLAVAGTAASPPSVAACPAVGGASLTPRVTWW